MRVIEGLRMTALDQIALDTAGVLQNTESSSVDAGLTPDNIELFLLVANAGAAGLSRGAIPKHLKAELSLTLINLEVQGLVEWEKNKHGRDAYLTLTWKGQEIIDRARPTNRKSLVARRRASIR